ncbi:3-deoxy-7-phosphoheptulonate synthase [Candidatus Peregrinibacteria bacterium RIFOXYA12_FULL_33_12]|nr:MAG: 3-deoxy-7-phosphoheptulonate synthase [Candidatus Peregrinibacteria bacterium RIFOXYA12_FULL_33_12]OGJ45025.1 MAG: 3-deoxy-7-phosphoheptulonate synthase [Candidatus Peregrinibacteria bacterium RIFOXYA2_FULL_33_21]OGJ51715.1 MAG: 3-deoxy-7-phosphoheptulonate synthase [Candidatus Peregrinibacteria bacterium RIFOXYB2_FULL_33_20]
MIIVMKRYAKPESVEHMIKYIESVNLKPAPLYGVERTVIAVIGDERILNKNHLMSFPEVSDVMSVLAPYKLVARETKYEDTIITLPDGTTIGDTKLAIMAGPCAVENQEQLDKSAEIAKNGGATILRGGAFKPRTSPYDFQGHGIEGLKMLRKTANQLKMNVISEIMTPEYIDDFEKYVDIMQVGARNMQNFDLLKAVGQSKKPVMLKRGLSATLKEFMLAAEYIMHEGNPNVILCERGIRTFETAMRNTLDLAAVAWMKRESHLPVIVDPSHATGKPELIPPMVLASIAAGADGIMIEVHCDPEKALCDGQQAMTEETFGQIMTKAAKVAAAVGRTI